MRERAQFARRDCAANRTTHPRHIHARRLWGYGRRTMRQVWITKAGPPEVLQVRESPDPDAAAGQVRIRVRAAGINFADLMARVGLYPDAPKIPCVVGYEVSGVVD